jgi:dTDP-4-dehydrorhamnose 3,5-epimerase
MKITPLALPGVLLIEPQVFRDDRGFFLEWFNEERFAQHRLPNAFRQDNHSRSVQGVVRGMHFQHPRAQGKLVTVVRGAVYDVVADIRVGSPAFATWCAVTLTEDEPRLLWVPPGFAHGFCAITEVADVVYKCTDIYVPAQDRCIRWSDPTLAITWPIEQAKLSSKDRDAPLLEDLKEDLPRYDG